MKKKMIPYKGACHCGVVRFEVELDDALASARRCNCSFCRMRGAIAVAAKLADFKLTAGNSALTEYTFNTNTAKHYFCSICGIYTHHQRRSDPSIYGVNAACLEGVSPFDFEEIAVVDGVNHPSDNEDGATPRMAGILKFIKNR